MTKALWVLPVLFLSFAPAAIGQTHVISGRVTASVSGEPLTGVTVAVVGTSTVALTHDDGRFSIGAPPGDVHLLFRKIGYQHKDVPVAAGQDSVSVTMELDVFVLDAVVVNGQATGVERRNATTGTTVVTANDIGALPAQTIDKALQGKVPGAIISQNSGAPGGGMQVQLRGVNTVLGNPDPLYVVDGVIYSNVSIPSGLSTVTGSGSNRGSGQLQDDPVNRLADLNPNDIESIEVLPGAAASAIYGSKAANGVIIIKTKRGQAGKTTATITQRLGFNELLRGYGTRSFTVAEAESLYGVSAVTPYIVNGQLPTYDHMQELAGGKPMNYQTSLEVTGGDENTRYFLSGSTSQDNGIIANTGAGRQTLRLNLDQTFSDRLKLSFSSAFNRTQTDRGITNNDNSGGSVTYSIAYIPGFEPLLPVNGVYPQPSITYLSSNPLQTAALATNAEVALGFTGGGQLTYQALTTDRHSVQFIAAGGVDMFSQKNTIIAPRELYFQQALANPGLSTLSNADSRYWNWSASLVDAFTPTAADYRLTTSTGVQVEDQELSRGRLSAFGLLPGQINVDQGALVGNVFEDNTIDRTLAFYAQEELLAKNERLDVTGAVRAERSSANGATDRYYIYPRLSASYRFPDLLGAGSDFKVRAGYGETGNKAAFGQKFTDLDAGVYSKHVFTTVDPTAGAAGLRPERVREIEGGFDATLANGRGSVEFTAYRRHTTDVFLNRPPAPSTGFSSEIINAGELMNEGIELGVGYTPIQTRGLTWVSRINFNTARNEVVSLPFPGFRPPNAGFGLAFGEFFLQPGKPTTQIIGQIGIDPITGNFIVGYMGQANPKFVMSFPQDIRYKRLSLNMLLTWQYGGVAQNQTLSLYDCNGLSPDQATPAGQQRFADCGSGIATPFVQSTSFLRMQNLSLSYDAPESWYKYFGGASSLRFTVSGQNLFLITSYTGYDPQVSNYGEQAVVRNIDLGPYPPSRTFTFTISAGF
ncbi:MAG TPA: SusC/RagA family TonB-linked outer membrane protein [Gemmatimonadales bacterium]|nr:SusC/RagA family TonB-linked outer membrane protein [Gemmatimonadales bacterium]